MPDPILQVVELRKRFHGVCPADNISLDVKPGEFRAIIGPNGAGKSTFFNLVTGFIRPDGGRVLFGGRNIVGVPPYRLFHLGMSRTFQITSIFGDLTVAENIEVTLLSHRRRLLDPFRRAAGSYHDDRCRLLETVGLSEHLDRKANTLSHGDQKRLELAVALANQPRLLLLDEPTAGMAAQERLESIKAVHRIAKRLGVTVVFTEHDMQVVFAVSDRISVLHQGRILMEGKPAEIRDSREVQEIYLGEEPVNAS